MRLHARLRVACVCVMCVVSSAGCGFNVSNGNPTACINDLVLQHNHQHGCGLDALTPAQLIARSLTLLERFIADFQLHGPHALLPLYYKRWVHRSEHGVTFTKQLARVLSARFLMFFVCFSGTRVRLWSEDGPEAEVMGLDENGFLQVLSGDQRLVSVQPDGNSFDMLRNLVVTKSS